MQVKLLLTNGKHAIFTLPDSQPSSPSTDGTANNKVSGEKMTVAKFKEQISSEWPKEWQEEQRLAASQIRILYRGRFLDDSMQIVASSTSPTSNTATGNATGDSNNNNNTQGGGSIEQLQKSDIIVLSGTELTTMHLVPKPSTPSTANNGLTKCKCSIL